MVSAMLTTRDNFGIAFQFSDRQQFDKAKKRCRELSCELTEVTGWDGLAMPHFISNIPAWNIPVTKDEYLHYYLSHREE